MAEQKSVEQQVMPHEAALGAESVPWSPRGLLGPFPEATANFRRPHGACLKVLVRMPENTGYDSLSADAIGREAGVNKNLMVCYFGSKKGLLVMLADCLLYEMGGICAFPGAGATRTDLLRKHSGELSD